MHCAPTWLPLSRAWRFFDCIEKWLKSISTLRTKSTIISLNRVYFLPQIHNHHSELRASGWMSHIVLAPGAIRLIGDSAHYNGGAMSKTEGLERDRVAQELTAVFRRAMETTIKPGCPTIEVSNSFVISGTRSTLAMVKAKDL